MRSPHHNYFEKPPRNIINLDAGCLNLIQTALDDATKLSIRREIKCENPFHNFMDLANWMISIEGLYIACVTLDVLEHFAKSQNHWWSTLK